MADRFNQTIDRKIVRVTSDGHLWINHVYQNLKQWDDRKTWSNQSGQENKDLRGYSIEEVVRRIS